MHKCTWLFVLLLAGCAGTQTRQAFSPRSAAAQVPFVLTPNVSADHDRSLDAVIDRSLREQERSDERADLMRVAPDSSAPASKSAAPASSEPASKENPPPAPGADAPKAVHLALSGAR